MDSLTLDPSRMTQKDVYAVILHTIASLWMYPQPRVPRVDKMGRSEEPDRLAHGGFDVQ